MPSPAVHQCKDLLPWPSCLTPVIQSLSIQSGIINSGCRVLFGIRNPGLIATYNPSTLNEYKITINMCSFDLTTFALHKSKLTKNHKSSKDSDLNYRVFSEHSPHLRCTSNKIACLIPFLVFASVLLTYRENSKVLLLGRVATNHRKKLQKLPAASEELLEASSHTIKAQKMYLTNTIVQIDNICLLLKEEHSREP